jgi:hypothetical protein
LDNGSYFAVAAIVYKRFVLMGVESLTHRSKDGYAITGKQSHELSVHTFHTFAPGWVGMLPCRIVHSHVKAVTEWQEFFDMARDCSLTVETSLLLQSLFGIEEVCPLTLELL